MEMRNGIQFRVISLLSETLLPFIVDFGVSLVEPESRLVARTRRRSRMGANERGEFIADESFREQYSSDWCFIGRAMNLMRERIVYRRRKWGEARIEATDTLFRLIALRGCNLLAPRNHQTRSGERTASSGAVYSAHVRLYAFHRRNKSSVRPTHGESPIRSPRSRSQSLASAISTSNYNFMCTCA